MHEGQIDSCELARLKNRGFRNQVQIYRRVQRLNNRPVGERQPPPWNDVLVRAPKAPPTISSAM